MFQACPGAGSHGQKFSACNCRTKVCELCLKKSLHSGPAKESGAMRPTSDEKFPTGERTCSAILAYFMIWWAMLAIWWTMINPASLLSPRSSN